ncbi:MAG: CoA transferase [Gammaproteobacteria bacterium]|nr:CoA transferase [Gammaproteobacteria bacterium]
MTHSSRPAFDRALAHLVALTDGVELARDSAFIAQPVALATRFRAAEAAAAALAGGAALANQMAIARGLPGSSVRVDSRHAEASLLSFAHLHFTDPERAPAGRQAPEQRTAAAGFFPTADGRWVYLHPGFPHNTQGLLNLLGVADDRSAVRSSGERQAELRSAVGDAVAGYSAETLEQAIGAAGLCGAMVRSAEEWDASRPGVLLAARPVVEIIQLDDSPPEPLPAFEGRALSGIRVLDLTRVLAGPTCARTLASYGASVLRVGASELPTIPLFVADTGFGKRSTHLDLTQPDAAQTLRRLLRDCDVFSQSYRSGAMDRLGFGVTDVAQLRPGIVYVSINCYGHEGPWRQWPGWEQLAQTVTGMALAQGEDTDEQGRPTLLPAAVTDYTTGYLAAFGALAALERRARVGGSYWVRVSLARTAMWIRQLGRRRTLRARPLADSEITAWQDVMDTPWGPAHYLRPAVNLSAMPAGWDTPPVPVGTHAPSFD